MRHVLRVAAVLGACALVACGRGHETEQSVRRALDEAKLQAVSVDVDNDSNIVHLKGTVDSAAQRSRAEEVAGAAVGTTGRVLNEVTVRGLNDDTADDLDGRIKDALDKGIKRDAALADRKVDFAVHNGMVAINGSVKSAEEKSRVEQIAKAAPGVKDVANGLEIDSAR